MPIAEAVEVVKQVCTGLDVAHSETPPIIHRDIKPQNILIGYNSSGMLVRLADFGLAKRVNALTLLASCQGTLGFKPPESFKNMDSCAADVWALGTTLYLLLTNTLPHPNLEGRDIHESSRFLNPLRPANLYNFKVDAKLESIVSKCLAASPKDRYPNAKALLNDLTAWQQKSHFPTETSQRSSERCTPVSLHQENVEVDRSDSLKTLKKAIELSKHPGKLQIAADLLEEAMNQDKTLRDRYESQLKLWRKGMCM